jgi:polysaccharide export outer membrane protein
MKRYFSFFIGICVVICIVSLSYAQDYSVGEEDLLKITIYDHPELTTTARVSGEGVINFPLIGDVKVGDMTTSQIAQKITDLLADGYIVDPHVSVFIEEVRSRKTVIMGQVQKPGIYVLSGNTSLLELLSKAGGLTKDAGDKAIIKRAPGPGRPGEQLLTINLKKLIEGDTSQNITLVNNDNIYVVKAGVVYVTGEVKRPDAYKLEEGTTVIKAVTMAGGFTDKASTGRVKIRRKVNGQDKVYEKVGMDEQVLPDDVIIVPESFF